MGSNLIISSKVTSFKEYFLGCGVDKLILKLSYSFSLIDLKPRLKEEGFEIKEGRNKQLKTNLLFKKDNVEIYCFGYIRPESDWEIVSIALKPNLFVTEDEMFLTLKSIFGNSIFDAIIKRIDINFDFKMKFIELLKGLDIKKKHKLYEYLSYSGELRSIRHGDENSIKVYDRAKKLKIKEDLSRIEFVFNLFKFQFKFDDYIKALKHILELSSMDNVEFIEAQMPFLLGINLYDKDFKKFIQFFCLFEKYGFTQAKKIFRKNDNFQRDYKKVIQCKSNPFNLKEIFQQSHIFVQEGPWKTR